MSQLKKLSFSVLTIFPVLILSYSYSFSANATFVDYSSIKETRPFQIENFEQEQTIAVNVQAGMYEILKNGSKSQVIAVPVSRFEELTLDLEKFEVVLPNARFVIGTPAGNVAAPAPEVVMFRGKVRGDYNSHGYISFTSKGFSSGIVTTNGVTHYIAYKPGSSYSTVTTFESGAELPPFTEFCGVPDGTFDGLKSTPVARGYGETSAGPIVAVLGLDADQTFYNIFGDLLDTQNYLLQLLGAVSDIYIRDFNMRLTAGFMRVWTTGSEPFNQNDLSSFADHWNFNEDTSGLDIIHLITARRNLSFGGIAYVSSYCTENRYSISGFMNGNFPTPVGVPSNSNWDVIVMAHELGHNFGTLHTHDISQYDPRIDSCAQNFPSRGTIMSYCHIHPGYTANIDLRFPVRVQQIVNLDVTDGADCFFHDCDGNGMDDAIDILELTYPDVNSNGIPDVCEDCNGNSILDDIDIAGPSNDVNENGIPDECEDDCDGNGTPDSFEAFFLNDINDNGILDVCEPDCNANDTADFVEIADGRLDDFDRNNVADICQDCNNNSIPDWMDLEREFNLYVADRNGGIREYHHVSGYPIQTLDPGTPYFDVVVGPDRMLYATTADPVTINKINPNTATVTNFSSTVTGGNGTLTYSVNGDIFLALKSAHTVRKINGTTGVDMGAFVAAGSGGISAPSDLAFGPDGHLYVSSETNDAVYKYDGATGAFMSTFVTSGSGGLDTPRGLAFKHDGNLLVTSYGTSKVYEYDGTTGAFIKQFNDENNPELPWGIAIGINGNVFIARTQDQFFQVFENLPDVGRYYRSFVRRDIELDLPAGIAFMPISQFDCDGNYVIDECEGPASACCCDGIRGDANGDGIDANILDLTFVVDYIFRSSGNAGTCLGESDANGDGSIGPNILDLTFLVDRTFRGGPLPGACAK